MPTCTTPDILAAVNPMLGMTVRTTAAMECCGADQPISILQVATRVTRVMLANQLWAGRQQQL
eukprot:11540016-Alexandrium_andersonii.AAC.1